jgi:hypothetical protein
MQRLSTRKCVGLAWVVEGDRELSLTAAFTWGSGMFYPAVALLGHTKLAS